MRIRRWLLLVGVMLGCLALTGCPKPPKKAMSDAEQALLDASGVKDCASDKYKAAQRLLDEARELAAEERYDAAKRKAKAAKKLAVEAKKEGELNWEDCKEQQEVAEKAEDPEPKEDTTDDQSQEDLSLETVFFGYDSSELSSKARRTLDENARWMERHDERRVVLHGHTDERGTPEYNLALGESRARRVKNYMIQLGIDGGRLSILSYGEEMPAAYGATPADYAKNRRVEFVPKN